MWNGCGDNGTLTLLTATAFMLLDAHLEDVVALESSSSLVRRKCTWFFLSPIYSTIFNRYANVHSVAKLASRHDHHLTMNAN